MVELDIENFFDSIHFGRVKGYFHKNKHFELPDEIAGCLANLVCYNGRLPQGSPSSPVITNLICAIMDRRIAAVAKKYKMTWQELYLKNKEIIGSNPNLIRVGQKLLIK